MDASEFRKYGKQMVDFVADYLETVRDRRPLPTVQPGYLQDMVSKEPPEKPEEFDTIFKDINRVIMPGITHWQSPQFHAYYPAQTSYPGILAEILSSGLNNIGFTWSSSPASAELEVRMMDWLVKLLNLPEHFLSTNTGGGVIQTSASESTLMAVITARNKRLRGKTGVLKHERIGRLVCYTSEQAHTSAERACMLAGVMCHTVTSDENARMRGDALMTKVENDTNNGLVPFMCLATVGTTISCAFDNIEELAVTCKEVGMWLHIDAAYAGTALMCPEIRATVQGLESVDSFVFNPHKWLLVPGNCSAMWLKNKENILEVYANEAVFEKHKYTNTGSAPDLHHWSVGYGKRFRSLHLWFVMRTYGAEQLRENIRKHIRLAKEFEQLVKQDSRFEITHEVKLGLVCFCLKQSNEVNENLLSVINDDGRIHMVPGKHRGRYFIRFAVNSEKNDSVDIRYAWSVISEIASSLEVKDCSSD